MTVAVAITCNDGIVFACDSLATFGRGVPVSRHTNKIHIVEHPGLFQPIALLGAGATAFVDKFIDRAKREVIGLAHKQLKRKLDIIDFCERVCEPVVAILFKEYLIDRTNFLGIPLNEFSLNMIVAGITKDGDLRSYTVHNTGLTESIEQYGTIGSGAAYAELFLRELVPDSNDISVNDASCLAVYAIKGVEIMDPYVGGKTNVCILKKKSGKLGIKPLAKSKNPKNAKDKMEKVFKKIGDNMRSLLPRNKKTSKKV